LIVVSSDSKINRRIDDFLIDDSKNKIKKLRTQKDIVSWHHKEELPFKTTEGNKLKMEIFDELENVVLLLRFLNDNDNKYDLLFFYLNKNVGNYEISHSGKSLSVNNKSIIKKQLTDFISTTIRTNRQDLKILQLFIENMQSLKQENSDLKDEIEIMKKRSGQSLGDLCNYHVKEISSKRSKEYKLSENAIKKIGNYNGDINNLKPTIERAISCIENSSFENNNQVIEINDSDIMFFNYDLPKKPNNNKLSMTNKFSKTELLLDKLENASQEVKSKNYSLTSANVGKFFPTPITAPAISDALKKHKKTILALLKKYPDKWIVIRKEFRPLLNIITAKPDLEDYYNSNKGN